MRLWYWGAGDVCAKKSKIGLKDRIARTSGTMITDEPHKTGAEHAESGGDVLFLEGLDGGKVIAESLSHVLRHWWRSR